MGVHIHLGLPPPLRFTGGVRAKGRGVRYPLLRSIPLSSREASHQLNQALAPFCASSPSLSASLRLQLSDDEIVRTTTGRFASGHG